MNIIFLISQMPYPPYQGAALRNFGLIMGLARKGHTISLLAIRDEEKPHPEDTPLATLCVSARAIDEPLRTTSDRLKDLFSGKADLSRRLYTPVMADALSELLVCERFDIIHMDIQSVDYLPIIQELASETRIVYDAHNAEYDLQLRIAQKDGHDIRRLPYALFSFIQAQRLKKVEADLCREASHIFACSEQDAKKLRSLEHHTPITVIPNAIDVKRYRTDHHENLDLPHPNMVFTGKMDYRPNVDAALYFGEEIFPLIRKEYPTSHFFIVGQKPHPRLQTLTEEEGIIITGFVPDVAPYMREADVYVVPLRMGSGTRFKLLESLAMGSKIVSTRIGAEGLGIEDGKHLLLADDPLSFAEAVIRLLREPALGEELTRHGRKFVQENFDWDAIIPRVEEGYRDALD